MSGTRRSGRAGVDWSWESTTCVVVCSEQEVLGVMRFVH